jgi:DNA-binding transcriptional ArsR family regulator
MSPNVDLAYVLFHPIRRKIISILRKANSAMYISQLASEMNIDDKLASFHLATLRQHNLVDSEWKMTEIGGAMKAVRYYKDTSLVDQVYQSIMKEIPKPIVTDEEEIRIDTENFDPDTFYMITYLGETYVVHKSLDGVIRFYEVVEE